MKRFYALLPVLWFLVTACCSGLPELKAGPDNPKIPLMEACRAVFPEGKRQFVHSIEASYPGGGENLLMGVTVIDAFSRTIDCALMTVEGFVLFRARMGRTIQVARAMPPFDRKGFADGLLEDLRVMFLAPAAQVTKTGILAGDAVSGDRPVCRYSDPGGMITDVIPGFDSRWQLRRYTPQGRLVRTVDAQSRGGRKGFPGKLILKAHGPAGYTLVMKLVDVVRIND